jgi:hypothetical protein
MKIVDTPTLKRLAARARRLGLNRLLPGPVEKALDPRGRHVLSRPFIHGEVECIRCAVVLVKVKGRDEPHEGQLDFSIDDWNRLPEYKEEPAASE